jgi:hypothetical protein
MKRMKNIIFGLLFILSVNISFGQVNDKIQIEEGYLVYIFNQHEYAKHKFTTIRDYVMFRNPPIINVNTNIDSLISHGGILVNSKFSDDDTLIHGCKINSQTLYNALDKLRDSIGRSAFVLAKNETKIFKFKVLLIFKEEYITYDKYFRINRTSAEGSHINGGLTTETKVYDPILIYLTK